MNRKFAGKTARGLARSIEEAVHAGTLQPGEPLPPIRQLAASSRLSPVTVAAAYRQLHSRGIVVGQGRRGTRVRPNPASPGLPADQRAAAEGLIDLATGNPDPDLLPPLAPALGSVSAGPHLYGEPSLNGRRVTGAPWRSQPASSRQPACPPITSPSFPALSTAWSVCSGSTCDPAIASVLKIRRCRRCSI